MTAIRINRKCLGWSLLVITPAVGLLVGAAIVSHAPWWSAFFIVPVVLGWSCLGHEFIACPPMLLIGDGVLLMRRMFLPRVQIPLDVIRAARVVRSSTEDGRCSFLEISLSRVPPELESWRNTWMKRVTVKNCAQYGGYVPPPEPFFIFSIPLLSVVDDDLTAIVERERAGVKSQVHDEAKAV